MKRIITGAVYAGLLVGTILLRSVSTAFFDALIGFLIIFASIEMSNALIKSKKNNNRYVAMIFPLIMYVIYLLGIKYSLSFGMIIMWLSVSMFTLCVGTFVTELIYLYSQKKKEFKNVRIRQRNMFMNRSIVKEALMYAFNTFITFVYPTLILGLLFVANHITEFSSMSNISSLENIDLGLIVLTLIFGVACITDVFAMVVGSVFGGPKMSPIISPNKTWSGAIGGVIFSLFGGVIIYFLFYSNPVIATYFTANNITIFSFGITALFSSIFAQGGDLFASFIKRKAGIKDFGNLLPGHGGALDRLDSVSFCVISVLAFMCIFFI